MTFRALDYGPPPDEQWVDVGYRTAAASAPRIELPWTLLAPGRAPTASRAGQPRRAAPGDRPGRRGASAGPRSSCSPPTLWAAESAPRQRASGCAGPGPPRGAVGEWIPTTFQDSLAARAVSAAIGYLRIWSFDVDDDQAFLDEAARLLALLPQGGLIVDLRGNPGGLIWAAERMLQLFTATPISPTRFSLVATPADPDRWRPARSTSWTSAPWADSLDQAISTGDQYAQPLPLTDPTWCNDTPRVYPRPGRRRRRRQHLLLRRPVHGRLGRPRDRPAGHRRAGDRRRRCERLDLGPAARCVDAAPTSSPTRCRRASASPWPSAEPSARRPATASRSRTSASRARRTT